MTDFIITTKTELDKQIRKFAAGEETRKSLAHRLLISALWQTAKHRNPAVQSWACNPSNVQAAMRNYVRNFTFVIERDEKGGAPTLKRDANGELVRTKHAFLSFDKKEHGGWYVPKGTTRQSNAFLKFIDTLVTPSDQYPIFLQRVNVKDAQVFGVDNFFDTIERLVKRGGNSDAIPEAYVTDLRKWVEAHRATELKRTAQAA